MSDEIKPRNDMDPAAQVAADVRVRLRAMASGELIDLAAQLLMTYVIEGVVPTSRAGEATDLAADGVGEESFAQMLKRLKAGKKDPVLDRFIIDGENISVRIDGQGVLPLTEYRRPNAPPPAAGQQRRENVPGAASSIYNRGLYQPDEAPARNAPPPQPGAAAQAPAQRAQQPGAPAQPGQKKDEEKPKNDRFSLIELE